MSSKESNDDRVERYLDGLMSEQEAAEFLQTVDTAELKQAQELQSGIDSSLREMLSGLEVDQQKIEEQFLRAGNRDLSSAKTARSVDMPGGQLMKLAIAASLLVAIGLATWFNLRPQTVEPEFASRPLTDVYMEKLQDFRPYYHCEDDDRFAGTFDERFGVALALSEMPADRKMLGLSYLGGIGPETVAMLCEAQGADVIVFVDRDSEPGVEEAIRSTKQDLNVFVERKFGLVFVEVTPLRSATMIANFELAN